MYEYIVGFFKNADNFWLVINGGWATGVWLKLNFKVHLEMVIFKKDSIVCGQWPFLLLAYQTKEY